MTEAKLLLLDGHSLAYRAFYALPVDNFATSTGQATNAVYGFTSMLINVIRDEKPTHVAVAFDVSRKTFRSDAFPEYKAQREKSPPEFAGQVDLVKELLVALDIPTIAVDGFEADDVIATVATQAETHGVPVAIVTGDRDAFQLVDERVTVLYPRKGMSDLARMTPQAVEEKYGVTPEQYPDYAALRGDPSDNLPGVPGVGEKTAAKWLQQFGDLTGLVDHADEIGGKVGESLREHIGQVVTNRTLTQLRRDVPLDHPWETFDWSGGSDERVDEVLDALQFRALRDRLFAIRPESQTPRVTSEVILTTALVAVDEMIPALQSGTWSVAIHGTWGAGTGTVQAMAVTSDGELVSVMDLQEHAWGADDPLSAWLANPDRPKNLHGAKGPALALRSVGVVLDGVQCDTELAAYILNPGQRSYDLPVVARQYVGREVHEAETNQQLTLGGMDLDVSGLGSQASAVHALAQHFMPALADVGSLDLLREIEIPLSRILVGMEFDGIAVDVQRLKELSTELATQMRTAELEAHRIVGHEFNLGSPKQLQQVLFEERGLPKTKKIKTGYTTDAEALQGLFASTADPLLEQLLVYRDRTKLRQTVDGLLPLVDAKKRIHTTFHQTATATGRLSSSDPNLQNIPVRTETGRRIRGCFIAGPKSEGLLTADYSQIELRIMAHASLDAGLIEAFAQGEDLHTTVASSVFDVDPAQVDPEMRRQIKAMSYGLAYGLSAFGLSQQLGIGVDTARGLMNEYFTRFGGVRDYLQRIVAQARQTGYTETLLGRRRYLPDLTSDNRQRREMAERMALNAPIQGTAADIVKVAMLEVDRRLGSEDLASQLILQVHDELVVQVARGERERVTTVVVEAMSGAAALTVPLDVSVGFGETWDSAAH